MPPRLETLLHLASVIDMKRDKLESALTDSRREQLSNQIALLSKHWQTEYTQFTEEQGGPEAVLGDTGLKLNRPVVPPVRVSPEALRTESRTGLPDHDVAAANRP